MLPRFSFAFGASASVFGSWTSCTWSHPEHRAGNAGSDKIPDFFARKRNSPQRSPSLPAIRCWLAQMQPLHSRPRERAFAGHLDNKSTPETKCHNLRLNTTPRASWTRSTEHVDRWMILTCCVDHIWDVRCDSLKIQQVWLRTVRIKRH